MVPPRRDPRPDRVPGSSFLTTRWSVLAAASSPDPVLSRAALETLCASTWYPLYAFVRRRGHDAEDARDLVQGFFARFLERADLGSLNPARGRFRSFLLASILNWLADEHERASARKRGGGGAPISIDFDAADERYRVDPGHDLTPEEDSNSKRMTPRARAWRSARTGVRGMGCAASTPAREEPVQAGTPGAP